MSRERERVRIREGWLREKEREREMGRFGKLERGGRRERERKRKRDEEKVKPKRGRATQRPPNVNELVSTLHARTHHTIRCLIHVMLNTWIFNTWLFRPLLYTNGLNVGAVIPRHASHIVKPTPHPRTMPKTTRSAYCKQQSERHVKLLSRLQRQKQLGNPK